MDFKEVCEIGRTAHFIHNKNFTKVALQFPDELLKDSGRVVSDLRDKLQLLRESVTEQNGDSIEVQLFVMADTNYGSCCVDEVGALHIVADCVIHYGHTCLSRTSTLQAFFVFGKASISISSCAKILSDDASTSSKPIVVLYGLEYTYAIPHVREELAASSSMQSVPKSSMQSGPKSSMHSDFHFADVRCYVINPSDNKKNPDGLPIAFAAGSRHRIAGLMWELPNGHRREDYLLVWIFSGNPALAIYDAKENRLVTDLSQQRRILKCSCIITNAICDTVMFSSMFPVLKIALLDSKDFLAPVITPFEAMVAFSGCIGFNTPNVPHFTFKTCLNLSPIPFLSLALREQNFQFLHPNFTVPLVTV
ncbi:hypothetical protein P3X46_001840, partial [Hevea brasiliensis]